MFDSIGGNIFEDALRVMAWNARVMIIGFASGTIPKAAVNRLLLKQASLIGVDAWGQLKNNPEYAFKTFDKLYAMQSESKYMKPVIFDKVYNFNQLPEAFTILASGQTYGKLVVKIKDEVKEESKL